MRHHRVGFIELWILACVVLGLAACTADPSKPSSDSSAIPSPAGTMGDGGPVIQQRAVPSRVAPGAITSMPVRPIQPAALPPPPPLPGEFVIRTMVKQTFLTAVDGGGRTTNAIHTDATGIGS